MIFPLLAAALAGGCCDDEPVPPSSGTCIGQISGHGVSGDIDDSSHFKVRPDLEFVGRDLVTLTFGFADGLLLVRGTFPIAVDSPDGAIALDETASFTYRLDPPLLPAFDIGASASIQLSRHGGGDHMRVTGVLALDDNASCEFDLMRVYEEPGTDGDGGDDWD